jgi:DNA-binding ferritin-like protein
MKSQHLQSILEETFAGNFVAYYHSHVAHVNTIGRNFYGDHKLLEKIYEYFQDNIDTLAEKLRTVRGTMPSDLSTVLGISRIIDMSIEGSSEELLTFVLEDIESMMDQYKDLNDVAEEVRYIDIANFAQDQIGQLAKFRWMLEAIVGEDKDIDEDEYDD